MDKATNLQKYKHTPLNKMTHENDHRTHWPKNKMEWLVLYE